MNTIRPPDRSSQIRRIRKVSPPLCGFYSKELFVKKRIPIRAHKCVLDESLYVAADRLGRLLSNLPTNILNRLADRGAALHIIGCKQQISDLPEYCHRIDDKRFNERRGLSGIQASVGEENLLDSDTDPRHSTRDIVLHEFAHTIMDIGFTWELQEEIYNTYNVSVNEKDLWKKKVVNSQDGSITLSPVYASTNAKEYFAEISSWYFGSHGQFVDRINRIPKPGPGSLASYDKDGFGLLTNIYSGTHPLLQNEMNVERILPYNGNNNSSNSLDMIVDGEEKAVPPTCREVNLIIRNESGFSWYLYFPRNNERRLYGKIWSGLNRNQVTYVSQEWELEIETSNGRENDATDEKNDKTLEVCNKRPQNELALKYVIGQGPVCLIDLAKDVANLFQSPKARKSGNDFNGKKKSPTI